MPRREQTSVVKIPLKLSESDKEVLDGQSRICNWLYNQLLDQANQLREKFRETQDPEISKVLYTERGLRNLIPGMKTEKPFLKVVHSSPLKNAALRASAAIQAYQKSRKKKRRGKQTGWPRFRSWGRSWFSLLYDEPNKGFRIEGSQLTLSLGMGLDREHRRVKAELESISGLREKEVRNLRIVKQLGLYYAVFTVKVALAEAKPVRKAIALDPNHKNLAYGVGTDQQAIEVAAPSWIKCIDRRIDELVARRDRCLKRSKKVYKQTPTDRNKDSYYWKPSNRWTQFDCMIEKLRRKRRDQTKTFLFSVAQQLFKQYDLVSIGDYTPNGTGETTAMRRSMNNQSLIGRFKEVLSWVALKSGKYFHEFCEKGTTRTCHSCNHVVVEGLPPSIRTWRCPSCSSVHLRDENAAQNGLKRVLRDLKLNELVPGSGLAFIKKRWAWCALPSGVVMSLRGQGCDEFTAPRNSNGSMTASDQSLLDNFVLV